LEIRGPAATRVVVVQSAGLTPRSDPRSNRPEIDDSPNTGSSINPFHMKRQLFAPVLPLIVAAGLCARSTTAPAATIGVDFGGVGNTVAPTDSAGAPGFAQTNWNAITAIGTNLPLNDNTGAATTASLTFSFVTLGFMTANATGADERLYNGVAFNSSSDWSFTLSGIPYANYSILVYHLSQAGDVRGATVGGTSYYSLSPNPTGVGYIDNNAGTPFAYNQATSNNPNVPGSVSDYALFAGLSGASQTVTISGFSGSNPRIVSAVQIVQVPEPSRALLLLGGLAMCFASRRRVR